MTDVLQFGLGANLGGVEIYIKTLWDYMDHNEYRFHFIDTTEEGKRPCFYEELQRKGCKFYKITPRRISIKRNQEDIDRLFRENHFDFMHFHTNTLSYSYPIESAIKNNCKVIVQSHNSETTGKLTKIMHILHRKKLQRKDVYRIAVSKDAGTWLFGNADFSVYLNGIETEKFRFHEENRAAIRKELNSENNLVIGHVGAFLRAKNHRFVIEIFEKALQLEPRAVLWLVGDGNSSEIKLLAEEKGLTDKVQFLGKRTDLPKLYAGMDAFLFPSLFEGFGLVIAEAVCEGLPCLISDCIPQEAIISDSVQAYSLNASAESWAKKLLDSAQSFSKDRTVCSREVAEAGFSVQAEVARIEKLYETVLSEQQPVI